MKKLVFAAALLLLAGCSAKESSTASSEKPSSAPETSTENTTETTAPMTHGELTFICGDDGITVKMDGEECGVISPDYIPKAYELSVGDFNFDGYEDIYFPADETDTAGDYYIYQPDEKKLAVSDGFALSDGTSRRMEITQDDKLRLVEYAGNTEVNLFYSFTDGKITPVSLSEYYYTDTDNILDIYEFDGNGIKYLTERTYMNKDNGAAYKTDTDAEYITVTEDSVCIMRGRETVQEIPSADLIGLNKKYIAAKRENSGLAEIPEYLCYEPEKLLYREDMDSDGYEDLGIPEDLEDAGGSSKFTYYRFEPESGKYVIWDELNALGDCVVYTETTGELVVWKGSQNDAEYDYYEYIWQNGRPFPKRHMHYYQDDSGRNICETFTFDENGNETLTSSGDYIMEWY